MTIARAVNARRLTRDEVVEKYPGTLSYNEKRARFEQLARGPMTRDERHAMYEFIDQPHPYRRIMPSLAEVCPPTLPLLAYVDPRVMSWGARGSCWAVR